MLFSVCWVQRWGCCWGVCWRSAFPLWGFPCLRLPIRIWHMTPLFRSPGGSLCLPLRWVCWHRYSPRSDPRGAPPGRISRTLCARGYDRLRTLALSVNFTLRGFLGLVLLYSFADLSLTP